MTTSKTIAIPVFGGSETFDAYVAFPDTSGAPAVLVCQEIFGVNASMKQICNDLAKQGFVAVCPDLFWRLERNIQLTDSSESDMKKAFELFEKFNLASGLDDLLAAAAFIRKMPQCSGKLGVLGYCLGGKLAYLMMSRSEADCGVSYYAVGLSELANEISDIRCPTLMHIAEKDKFVPPAERDAFLKAVKRNALIQADVYMGVDHAFARPNGVHFDESAATIANARTKGFLRQHLMV